MAAFGLAAPAATATAPVPFRAEIYEELHGRAVAVLAGQGAAASGGHAERLDDAFSELRKHRDGLARPLAFRPREETADLQALGRHLVTEHPRLASERLARVVDEVSKTLHLNQLDCCVLVERAMDLTGVLSEVASICAAMYYRECHFLALCLHDMAQGLEQNPPPGHCVAFFAMLGGHRFVKGLLEALGLLLRDLTGERTGDQMFLSHAGAMIQLIVETLLAYFFRFKATAEEAEQIISLLPHVVNAQHAPLGQGFTVSDLDLILREEHTDISTKLCLVLVCMCCSVVGENKLDISKVPEAMEPRQVEKNIKDYTVSPDGGDDLLRSSALGTKMQVGDYWNEESQLGQFLHFAINGVLLEDTRALRKGYVHWNVFHFLSHEVLNSASIIGESCTSHLVLRCIQDLLARALLPVGRRWVQVRTLEAQAASYRLVAPDALQIAALQALNRLCRVHPAACEVFRDIALHYTDTFHFTTSPGALLQDAGGGSVQGLLTPAEPWGARPSAVGAGGLAVGPLGAAAARADGARSELWIGAPPMGAAERGGGPLPAARPHDSSALYAEILDLLASVCARGTLHCACLVYQKLMSHSNQWFNWGFLVDTMRHHARVPPSQLMLLGAGSGSIQQPLQGMVGAFGDRPAAASPGAAAPITTALCHLVSAMCGSRLWISQPPPQPSAHSLQMTSLGVGVPTSAETFAAVTVELLSAHPDYAVKAASLGALSHFDFTLTAAKAAFSSLVAALPALLAGVADVRGSHDGALAIELLSCALRLAQAIPLGKGRYGLDLQPITHVVVHHIYMKVLANPEQFSSASRYWRLAALALRWLRLVLRGPLPPVGLPAVDALLLGPYAQSGESAAEEVAARSMAGNATVYAFRCMLTLDSPVFARALQLTLIGGRGPAGLVAAAGGGVSGGHGFRGGGGGGAARPHMEQAAAVGFDLIRLLLQRDVLFCSLYCHVAAERATRGSQGGGVGAAGAGAASIVLPDPGGLLPAHKHLLAEYAFPYPPAADGDLSGGATMNPFASRRLWQCGPVTFHGAGGDSGTGGVRRHSPSYLAMLLEYIGLRACPQLCKHAVFVLGQCALREPSVVLRTLQLESWRLRCVCADLHDIITQPEEDNVLEAAAKGPQGKWNARAEAQFIFEAAEMDTPSDATMHLDVASFQTGLPVCRAVDQLQQLADDAAVQAGDLAAWACLAGGNARRRGGRPGAALVGAGGRALRAGCSSADTRCVQNGYLRGLDIHCDWFGAEVADDASQGIVAPPPVLAMTPCRLLALRFLLLLLGGGDALPQGDSVATAAAQLARLLLGFDPEGEGSGVGPGGAGVDMDSARAGQPSILEAVMAVLEQPPPMPVYPESDALKVSHRQAFRPQGGKPEVGLAQTLQQHATYEAALGVLLALLSAPALHDVALRYVCHAWPSRYEVLRGLLALPWPAVPQALRRILLSQVTLMLQTAAWEMRLVRPLGAPQPLESESLSLAARQQLEMKRAVAEHLQAVVSGLVTTPTGATMEESAANAGLPGAEAAGGAAAHGTPPFLVAAALRLAEACETKDGQITPTLGLSSSACFGFQPHNDALHDAFEAATCLCLAPTESESGGLGLCLELRDPQLFQRLLGPDAQAASPLLPPSWDSTVGAWPNIVGGPAEAAAGTPSAASSMGAALRDLGLANEASCAAFFASAVFRALSFFVAGVLFHLTGGIRPGSSLARDWRVQAVRAHLEALLPTLAAMPSLQGKGSGAWPQHLDFFAGVATALIRATPSKEAPPPLSFVYSLFCCLRDLAVPEASASANQASSETARRHAQQALLLLAQRLLPDPNDGGGSAALAQIDAQDLDGLRRLVNSLVCSACAAGSVAASGGGSTERARSGLGGGLAGAAAVGPGVALPLLVALLLRVPRQQLPEVLSGPSFWPQLIGLLSACAGDDGDPAVPGLSPLATSGLLPLDSAGGGAMALPQGAGNEPVQVTLWLQVACLASIACQAPALAASFFESGGLAAALRPGFLLRRAASVHLALPGLPVLDGMAHPATLLVALQLLVSVTRALPTHALALHSVLVWLEQHQKPLIEILRWVARLPLTTAAEPQDFPGVGGSAARSSGISAAIAACRGSTAGRALLVLCAGDDLEDHCDQSMEIAALALSGRHWEGGGSIGAALQAEECSRVVALGHRCVMLFTELWASLWVASSKSGVSALEQAYNEPLRAQMAIFEAQLEELFLGLLSKLSSAAVSSRAPGGDAVMRDVSTGKNILARGVAPSAGEPEEDDKDALRPSEATRFAICLYILHVWRSDSVTLQLQAMADWHSSALTGLQPSSLAAMGGLPSSYGAPGGAFGLAGSPAGLWLGAPAVGAQQLVAQARARTGVLLTAFVHAASALLTLRVPEDLAAPPAAFAIAAAGAVEGGSQPRLHFEGSPLHFRRLLHIVEVCLHLLRVHLSVLAAAAGLGGPTAAAASALPTAPPGGAPGPPRLALVAQYLGLLQQLSAATGGVILPTAATHSTGAGTATTAASTAGSAMDLGFVSAAARNVAELLAQLQGL